MLMLTIDNREPSYLINSVAEAAVAAGIPHQIHSLDRCDYVYEGKHKIGIERKVSDGDLLTSLASGRLQRQLSEMLIGGFDVAILGIEGYASVDDKGFIKRASGASGWQWAALSGLLTSVQSMGIQVHWIPKHLYTWFIMSQIKYWDKDRHTSIINQPKPFPTSLKNTTYDNKRRVLMSFPGIGEELADRILAKLTLAEIFNDPNSLKTIEGLGDQKISNITGVLYG